MTERNDHDDLDRRIHDLLGRAVASTPPAPKLDEGVLMTPTSNQPNDRNRWIIGGLTGLSVAAVIVAILLFARPDEVASPLIPATPVPTTPTSLTVPATPDSTSVSTSVPAVEPATTSPPSTEAPSTTAEATASSTTTEPTVPLTPVRVADLRLQAGPTGVEVLGIDGRVVTTEAMAIARLGPDDSFYMQRSIEPDGDTTLLNVGADGSAPIPVPLPAPLDGSIRLHDSAVVDGRWTVLIELLPPLCPSPDDCAGGIYIFRPDDGSVAEIDSKNVWEAGWEQLSLSETGVIVGGEGESAVRMPYIRAVPGAPGPVPDVATLGLDDSYADCSGCPQGFTINRVGDAVAWVEGKSATLIPTVRMVALDGTTLGLAEFPGTGVNIVIPVVSLGAASVGGEDTTPIAIVNDYFVGDREFANLGSIAPVYVDFVSGEVDVDVAGTIATYE